jgi:hypothetical protein
MPENWEEDDHDNKEADTDEMTDDEDFEEDSSNRQLATADDEEDGFEDEW